MKTKKKTLSSSSTKSEPSFEHAIDRLEHIVTEMEAAQLPLEDILKKYEEGTQLVRYCTKKLEEAEKKIELLTKKADGTVELAPFQSESKMQENREAPENDDNGELF